ncbi:MAG: hypothetical protein P8X90_34105, partial [Desulfobacterales bacterium]
MRNQFGEMQESLERPTRICVASSKWHERPGKKPDLLIGLVQPQASSAGQRGFPGFDYCLPNPTGGASKRIGFSVRNSGAGDAGATQVSVMFEN